MANTNRLLVRQDHNSEVDQSAWMFQGTEQLVLFFQKHGPSVGRNVVSSSVDEGDDVNAVRESLAVVS